MEPSPKLPAFHLMAKPCGPQCITLPAGTVSISPKKPSTRTAGSGCPDTILEAYIQQTIVAHLVPEVTFAWQGGEPTLLGRAFFKKALELQKKYCRPGMVIRNTLQTNGILLDQTWCRFLRQNNFLVGISIDGPGELHDALRKDNSGKGTFDRVMKGLSLLKKHGVEYNILCTVNSANGEYPLEVYRFFRDEIGARFIQFIPVVARDEKTGEVTAWALSGLLNMAGS